ncbi:MAG: HNH endonuclease [Nanoarchaeota archaeon]
MERIGYNEYIDDDGYKRKKQIKYSNLVHRQVAYNNIFLKNRNNYSLPFSKYVVHHVDGNKKNNAISNLIIITREDHEKLHMAKERQKEIDLKKLILELSKEKYSNAYDRWTTEADKELSYLFHEGRTTKDISELLKRSGGAIWSRIKKIQARKLECPTSS